MAETLVRTYAALAPAERCRAPYLHIDPCYVNIYRLMRTFGAHFKEYYNQRSIKEQNDYARIFNLHLMTTFAMDALRARRAGGLIEALADARPPTLFCSVHEMEGTAQALTPGNMRARNRILLPVAYGRPVSVQFSNYNFLSDVEREDQARGTRLAVLGQVEIADDQRVVVEALIMGTPTFDHFRNEETALDHSGLAAEWFELLPGDIAGLRDAAPPPGDWPGLGFAEARLADGETAGAAILDAGAVSVGSLARLAAAPAHVLCLRGAADRRARQALRETAALPHAPRHYCVLDGAA